MPRDYQQVTWSPEVEEDCRQLVRLAIREDFRREYDWTTLCLIDEKSTGAAQVVARQSGILAGLPAARVALEEMNAGIRWEQLVEDGQALTSDSVVAELQGSIRSLLGAERLVLNLLGKLSGIATLTHDFVQRIRGTKARIYDTRKTTPGWRLLEKYAVSQGGGHNHRRGLYDGILIKDNHLAALATPDQEADAPRRAVALAREFATRNLAEAYPVPPLIEVEVDTLDQLKSALADNPDIVLLDNMSLDDLREAVRIRDSLKPDVELEASGGVSLDTVRDIAETGVERISAGALTHHAVWLDLGLDWRAGGGAWMHIEK